MKPIIKQWTGPERRRFPRTEVHVPAIYRSANHTVDGHVCNIGRGGARLCCPRLDPEGEPVEIQLVLPGQTEVLELRGRIVWLQRSPDAEEGDMGLSFDELNRQQLAALSNFLIARFTNS